MHAAPDFHRFSVLIIFTFNLFTIDKTCLRLLQSLKCSYKYEKYDYFTLVIKNQAVLVQFLLSFEAPDLKNAGPEMLTASCNINPKAE